MPSRATHTPPLARPGFAKAAWQGLVCHGIVLTVIVVLFPGCGSGGGQAAKRTTRAPKTFRQSNSSVRPATSTKGKANSGRAGLPEPTEEQSAATAMVGIGKPAVPELVKTLRSENPDARRQAALVLARIGPDAKDAVDELIVALDDSDPKVRKAAARALGNIGPAAERAVPYLVRVMSGEPADTEMDDEYSVAPPRVERRGSSAKTQSRPPPREQNDPKKAKPWRTMKYDAGTDDVVIESSGNQKDENKDAQASDVESDTESTEADSHAEVHEDTDESKTSTSNPPPPAKYSSPSKLRPKGQP
jgi:hypothetical protein